MIAPWKICNHEPFTKVDELCIGRVNHKDNCFIEQNMGYNLSFVLIFAIDDDPLHEIENKDVNSYDNSEYVVVVRVETECTGHKLRLIDIVPHLQTTSVVRLRHDSFSSISVHIQTYIGVNLEI